MAATGLGAGMAVAALSATYLGGYPERPDRFTGIVNVNDHGIEMFRSRAHFSIPWSSVSWLAVEELDDVDFPEVERKDRQAFLVTHLRTEGQAVFEFEESPTEVRRTFGPWLAVHGAPEDG
jgi:hypothetical protein